MSKIEEAKDAVMEEEGTNYFIHTEEIHSFLFLFSKFTIFFTL